MVMAMLESYGLAQTRILTGPNRGLYTVECRFGPFDELRVYLPTYPLVPRLRLARLAPA